MNILIADDEPLELEQMIYLLKPHFPNWTFHTAQDASQALQLAKKHRMTIAFLDIQMPGKDGISLSKELKALYEVDIIMVTAYQTFEYAQQALRIGVKDYLTKPVIASELDAIVEKYKVWSSNHDAIQSALSYIHENYYEKLSLNIIAEKIHLNPSYLSRKFLEEQSIGINEYINNYRLEMAVKKINENLDTSMSAIAESCGFNSQHYFSVAFKKKYNQSPRQYKSSKMSKGL
ncbi:MULTISPECIES: response regulator [Lysinibacillus]|uniref:Chemotaxis protein CheY n=1 Tax=Lysinibacillus boronitolerans JCM 21713 = 10a = NBRC 103108 TaxID=1294264 RepID=A0ABR4XYR5_9BACI|nr:response regulator [Lysinibacillus boronitolerans]KGR84200.1 chemotaxis protein CheY [Lysinibacillus boronitolerans JCM 21713 = 10a = NBRC 103108]